MTNQELAALQKSLLALIDSLRERIATAASKEEVEAILREIQEVFHRATLVGSFLFVQITEAMTQKVDGVRDATDALHDQIQKLGTVKNVLKGVSDLLATVDKVLDAIKNLSI